MFWSLDARSRWAVRDKPHFANDRTVTGENLRALLLQRLADRGGKIRRRSSCRFGLILSEQAARCHKENQSADLHIGGIPILDGDRECRDSAGAGDGIRTRDIDLGKVALYQLSYSRSSGRLPFSSRNICPVKCYR